MAVGRGNGNKVENCKLFYLRIRISTRLVRGWAGWREENFESFLIKLSLAWYELCMEITRNSRRQRPSWDFSFVGTIKYLLIYQTYYAIRLRSIFIFHSVSLLLALPPPLNHGISRTWNMKQFFFSLFLPRLRSVYDNFSLPALHRTHVCALRELLCLLLEKYELSIGTRASLYGVDLYAGFAAISQTSSALRDNQQQKTLA